MTARKHSPTSKAAWDSVKDHLSETHQKILDAMKLLPVGGTTYELSNVSNIPHPTIHKRVSEIEAKGLVFKTGITRPSPSGRKCSVYQLSTPPAANEPKVFTQPELF